MTKEEFISEIAQYVKKYAPKYGISVCSPIIAQACLESAFGTSTKAKYHNYFGLKYRKDRVTCNNGYFKDGGSEQNANGTYTPLPSSTAWYSFDSMELGVKGYFEFININKYANLKGVTDPKEYLEKIKADGYATSLKYVENVFAVIQKYNLTKYDNFNINDSSEKRGDTMGIVIVPNSGFKGYNVSSRSAKIQYIVLHYTGAEGSAKNNVSYFNGGNRSASADFFVGHGGEICQYNPDLDKYNSWHCGGGRQSSYGGTFFGKCTNSNSIGIEMCCHQASDGSFYFMDATINAAVELVDYLMDKYNVPLDHVITHYMVTGKKCPGVKGWTTYPGMGGDGKWQEFKNRVESDEFIYDEEAPMVISGVSESWNATGTAVCTASTLNVRSGAGTGNSVIGQIQNGNRFEVNGEKSNGWIKVKVAGIGIGWVSEQYVKYDGVANSATAAATTTNVKPAETFTKTGTAVVRASALNVRAGAGTNYAVVTSVANGTKIETSAEKKAGFVKVRVAGKTIGWVSEQYITYETSATSGWKAIRTATCTASVLNVRSAASLGSSILGAIGRGNRFEVNGEEYNGWIRVKVAGIGIGWVSKQYIKYD